MVKAADFITVQADSGTAFTYKGVKPDAPIRYCNCGCGQQVVKKAIYRPGHDARHVSELALAIVEFVQGNARRDSLTKQVRLALGKLPSVKLQIKLTIRLMKELGERYADMLMVLQREAIEAAEGDDEGDE